MRRAPTDTRNHQLGDWTQWAGSRDNRSFFTEALRVMDQDFALGNRGLMNIVLIGARDLPGVTLRRAQGVLRWDRRPSLWSHALLIDGTWDGQADVAELPILEIPLFPRTGHFPSPEGNGLGRSNLGLYLDEKRDANVALLTVARREGNTLKPLTDEQIAKVQGRAKDPNYDRQRYDLWDSLGAWQPYVWSLGESSNPLRAGVPVPASAFVEMAFEALRLDLVPGASERNSAPEHLWNAAVWWHQSGLDLPQDDSPFVMTGCFALRDKGCALLDD